MTDRPVLWTTSAPSISGVVFEPRVEELSDKGGLLISEGHGWPDDAEIGRRPDLPEIPCDLGREPDAAQNDLMRRAYEMNQELADYISENLRIEFGNRYVRYRAD